MLTDTQKTQMVEKVAFYAAQLNARFKTMLVTPLTSFDTKGSAAGTADMLRNRVSFNEQIAAGNFDKFDKTIAHEVSHIFACILFKDYGHGRFWKLVFRALGFTPDRCHEYDMTGVTVRRQGRHKYTCGCPGKVHELSTRRHNKFQAGKCKNLKCLRCMKPVVCIENMAPVIPMVTEPVLALAA
jgi:SprT protein